MVIFVSSTLTQKAESYWNEVTGRGGEEKIRGVRNRHGWTRELSVKDGNGDTKPTE